MKDSKMKKKLFNFMLGEETKVRARAIAERRGKTLSAFINEAIELLVTDWEKRIQITENQKNLTS